MYTTCLFCHGDLGRNDVIEAFPVGRRLAFDAAKGRLWVVCGRCDRWNLTPLEERWEAIEDCERRFRATRIRASTPEVGLARLREGLHLVRVGRPLLPEFAAWRYGERFLRRRRAASWVAGVGAVAGAAALPVIAPAIPTAIGAFAMFSVLAGPGVIPYAGAVYFTARDYIRTDRIVAQVWAPGRTHVITIRAKHVREVQLHAAAPGAPVTLVVPHDGGVARYGGAEALTTAGLLLSRSNWLGASPRRIGEAVARIEHAGDAASFLAETSRVAHPRNGHRVMAEWRDLTTMNLSPVERLALEMAVHDALERRALAGELAGLEAAWRSAEEIAAIADDLLVPDGARAWIGRQRNA